MPRRAYAIVGTGGRHQMYRDALLGRFADTARLVALCDANAGRLAMSLDVARERTHTRTGSNESIGGYAAEAFDALLGERRPQTVIVTSMDSTHDEYVCRAMAAGCDVITEKPLTISAAKLQRIVDTKARTGATLTVAFNYRYSPVRSQVKRALLDGVVGEITAVDFQWLLDTRHGADYFRRWHRNKANSGGLLVHKATHHFDLVNWWLESVPQTVHATGERRYYRPEQAERLGLGARGERCHGCAARRNCPFYFDITAREGLRAMYFDQERHDGYQRDQCVFSAEIDIEDTMSVRVRYANGATMTYSLYAYAPWEGYRIAFNGTAGRLEHEVRESSYASGDGSVPGASLGASVRVFPHFAEPYALEPARASGGHGGGDRAMLDDLFGPASGASDPLQRRADYRAGAWSILTGIAANLSVEEGRAVQVGDLVSGLDWPDTVT